MKRKAFSTGKQFGSALGDFLRTRRAEIAEKEAGPDGDVEAVASALMEELAACVGSAEDYAQVESGDKDPTPEQADALAAVLARHGVEATGADLLALDEKADASADGDAAQANATEEMRKGLEAAQGQVTTLRADLTARDTELGTLRTQVANLTAKASADAPYVLAGKAELEAMREDVLKRVALRTGKAPDDATKSLVAVLDRQQLETYRASLGADPLVDPMCAVCGKPAEKLHRSSVAAETVTPPLRRLRAADAKPSGREQNAAARAHLARLRKAGDQTSTETDALRAVRAMTAAAVFELVDEHDSNAGA